MILISILAILLSFPTNIDDHEFHVSKTLLEYKPDQQTLQVTLNIFIDDLELALENTGSGKLFLCTKKEVEDAEMYIFDYLKEHVQLNINAEDMQMNWVGKESSDDLESVWCYIEINNIQKLESLKIKNSILMEVFDDQKNIVQIIGPEKKSGYFMFQKGNDADSIEF